MMTHRHRFASPLAACALVAAALGHAASATAQDDAARSYPMKPVRIVIGLAAGGGVDVITRVVAQRMAEGLGQQVVVESKPGASGIIAAEFVARAPADGYTLMMAPSGPMVFNAVMFSKLPYSAVNDFVPVGMVANFPLIAVVNSATPVRTMRELADFARANPARANYAASTAAFQLATELFNSLAGIRMENITYKSTTESMSALMAGDVLAAIADPGPATAAIRGGRVRPLAVTSAKRLAAYPDVPTMAEAGYPQLDVQLWVSLFAPAGTPGAIVRKLEGELTKALKTPEVLQSFAAQSLNPGGAGAAEVGPMIAAEIARWRDVAKKANIKLNN